MRNFMFVFKSMDQISIKTPNPKCCHYWCLIEFIDWRYSQSCWYFRPLLWTSAPLTFPLVHLPPPLPCVNKYRVTCIPWVCNRVGGDSRPHTDKHLPPSTFTGQFLRKAPTLGFGVYIDIWSMVINTLGGLPAWCRWTGRLCRVFAWRGKHAGHWPGRRTLDGYKINFFSYFYKECAYWQLFNRTKVRYFEGVHINFFLLIGIYLHKDCFRPVQCLNLPVLGISDILVRIWIRGSIPLTNESRSNSGFCKHYFSLLKTFMRKGRIRIRTTD